MVKKAPKRHSSSHALLNQSSSSSSVAAFGNLRRKVMKQISHDSLNTTANQQNNTSRWSVSSGSAYSSPDPTNYQQRRTSLGRLFARPLSDLVDNADENVVPGAVLDIIKAVFRDGLYLEGIFRKPPNHRICREIREKLDSGQQVNFYDVQPTVAASLLKEFLRLLPDSLLISSEFPSWLQLCDEKDVGVRIEKAK
uniref:Rho-GAP domain-containing protein n=1 Tax=Romanomermis culicivorax TaxID=13658 RepID=A0A915IF70_ROMCU